MVHTNDVFLCVSMYFLIYFYISILGWDCWIYPDLSTHPTAAFPTQRICSFSLAAAVVQKSIESAAGSAPHRNHRDRALEMPIDK